MKKLNNNEMFSVELTIASLCSELSIADATARLWLRQGLPSRKEKDGKRTKIIIDRAAAQTWLLGNDKAEYACKLVPSPPSGVELGGGVDGVLTMRAMVDRLRNVEVYCYGNMQKAIEDEKVGETDLWMEKHQAAVEQRRKVEKDLSQIELSQHNVIPKATADAHLVEMALAVKTALLALPDKCATLVENRGAVEVAEILRREVKDCLRGLSEGGDTGKE